jgi:hypothetical protein
VLGVHPGFLPSLLDGIYLLNRVGTRFDWPNMLALIDNELMLASLYVTLSYISRHKLCAIPREAISYMGTQQRLVGHLQLFLIHMMLDWHLIGARRWNLFVPLPVPGRYNLRNQLRKRFFTRLRSSEETK